MSLESASPAAGGYHIAVTTFWRLLPSILIGLISAAMAALGGIVSALPPTNPGQRISYTVAFIVLSCGAWMAAIWQSKRGMKSEAELRVQVAGLRATIGELQCEVSDLGRANTELAKEGIAATTGGDSFCRMIVNHQFGYPTPVFVHSGKYTLYDVNVRITDLKKLRMHIQPCDVSLKLGEMHVGGALHATARLPFSDGQAQDFNIFFSARNGMWVEKLRLRKVNGEWASACQVWLTDPSKPPEEPMFEEVSADYPRAENGLVDWGK